MMRKAIAETERLIFYEFAQEDAVGFYQLNADPEVMRFTGDPPFENVDAARRFLLSYDHYQHHGFGRWSLYHKDERVYLGFCGLKYSTSVDEVDLGFRIKRAYWGQGYATEAGLAALTLGFERYGLKRIVGRVQPKNSASQRVLEKLMMKACGESFDGELKWLMYELSPESS